MKFTAEKNRDYTTRLRQHIDNKTTDLADAVVEFDPKIYSDPKLAELEFANIFQKMPVLACHGSQIANPGDFIVVQLARTSAVITRGPDGQVSAFMNVCRHRGAKLVFEPSGNTPLFRCRYHAWAYSSDDGALKAMPQRQSFGMEPCPQRDLIRLPVEEFHGLVWVLENPQGQLDIRSFLGPSFCQFFEDYGVAGYHYARSTELHVELNWKAGMDGYMDVYHLNILHANSIGPYLHGGIMAFDPIGQHARWCVPRKKLDKVQAEELPTLDAFRYVIGGHLVFPNLEITIEPNHLEFVSFTPHPTDTTKSIYRVLFLTPDKVETPEQEATIERSWQILMSAVRDEDLPIGEAVQAGTATPQMGTLLLGRNEIANQFFYRQYERAVGIPVLRPAKL
ncbi:MAG: hypothetical protein JWQ90_2618 [Hydrocarboniphaga sp.]|uniref:aromatic ring-hydroxylating oxygenase subunit alpha n=1 Tax=Hydrocarboniphaga sp. TaxID=2033016 RepID=UPI00262E6778|nr:aromatic ring-hydroxylating dioxygenase subunit alpha [Hydrocarboniphaga sp.]MDB5970168.1 hypothetical protein [Hydrocarboniphaga sp.]